MTPALVRLPSTVLSSGSAVQLAACVDAVGDGRTVLIGTQRSESGDDLDAFVVAVAVAQATTGLVGVAAPVGAGRAASIVAREATAAQLLGACHALYLDGDAATCRDAATVIAALFTDGVHTVST